MDPEHPRKRLDLSRVKGKDKEKEPPIDTPSQENAPDPEPPSKELNMPYNKSKGKEKAPPIGTLAQEMADPSAGLKNSNRAKSKEKGKTPVLPPPLKKVPRLGSSLPSLAMTLVTSNDATRLGSGSSSTRTSIPTDQSREGSASSLGMTPMTSIDLSATPSGSSHTHSVDKGVQAKMHGMIDSKRKSQSGEHGSLIDVQNSRTSTSRPASPAVPPPASTTQNCRSDQMHPQMQDVLSGPPDDSATIDYLPLNNTTNDRTFIAAMLPLFLSNFNTATSTLVNQPRAPPGLYNDVYIRHLRGLESGPIPTHDPDLAFHGNESSGHDSGATTSHHETIPESPLLSQGTFANPNPFENTLIEYSSGESSPAFSPCQPHKLSPVEEKESQIGSDDSSDDYSAVLPGSAGAIAAADLLHEQSLMILDEESLGIVDVVDGVSATTPPEEEGPSNTAATDSTTPQAYESTRVGEPSDTDWALVVTSDPDTRSTVDAIGQDMDQFLIGGGFRRVESSGAVPDDEPTNEGDDRDDCILSRPQGYSGRGCGVNSTPFYLAKFNTLMKIIRSPDPEDPSKLGIELWEVWDPYPHHKTMNIIGPRFDPSGLDGTIEVQASGHFDCSPDFDPDKRFRRTSMRPLYGLQKLPDWISELKQAFGYPSAESSSQQVPPPYVPSVRKPLGETKISVNEVGSESDVDLKEDDVLEGFPDLESPKTNGKKNKKIWRK